MERRTLRRIGAAAVGIVLLGAVVATRSGMRDAPTRAAVPDVNASPDARVRVEVLNATTIRGLARRATLQLRDRGLDVVQTSTSPDQRDSTLVLDRSNHPDWANRVAAAMGGATVLSRPDTSRYVDVTVLLGRAWRPPSHPLYP